MIDISNKDVMDLNNETFNKLLENVFSNLYKFFCLDLRYLFSLNNEVVSFISYNNGICLHNYEYDVNLFFSFIPGENEWFYINVWLEEQDKHLISNHDLDKYGLKLMLYYYIDPLSDRITEICSGKSFILLKEIETNKFINITMIGYISSKEIYVVKISHLKIPLDEDKKDHHIKRKTGYYYLIESYEKYYNLNGPYKIVQYLDTYLNNKGMDVAYCETRHENEENHKRFKWIQDKNIPIDYYGNIINSDDKLAFRLKFC